MEPFTYGQSPVPIREDLAEAHRRAFERISRSGTWWTAPERVAIAGEVRAARDCDLCVRRKQALSPFAVDGDHERPLARAADLTAGTTDAIHRLVTDPARLSRNWLGEQIAAEAFTVEQYVELIGVVTQVLSIDTVHFGLGLEPEPLPDPESGEPSKRRPSGAAMEEAWVPMVTKDRLDAEDADIYPDGPRIGNVIRALSLVPAEVRALRDLSDAHYLSVDQMMKFGQQFRSITRAQIELVAGRVSALNECFY